MPLKHLEQEYAAGRYVSTLREFQRLMLDLPNDDPTLVSKLYLLGGMTQMQLQDFFAAAKMLEIAKGKAEGASIWETTGKVRFQLGVVYRRIGDTVMALENYLSFLQDIHRYPELAKFQGPAHYNLALVHRQRKDLANAIAHYLMAEPFMLEAKNPAWLLSLYQNLAWTLYEQADRAKGDAYRDKASAVLQDVGEEDHLPKVRQTLLLAFAELTGGETRRATSMCEEILTPGAPGNDETRAWATWILAECACQVGARAEARALINVALSMAVTVNEPRLMTYLALTRRKLHEQS